MKRAGNVRNTRQHLRLIRVIAGADEGTNGDARERCTRRTSSLRDGGSMASRADGAPGINPRVVVGTSDIFRRRLRMGLLVPPRIGRRGRRVHALGQHDGNPVGQRVRRFLAR
jgi:hypothetical protein